MLLAGDEMRRSQHGNNNAYNQDNETSWLDWDQRERQRPLVEFVAGLIRLRQRFSALRRQRFFTGDPLDDGHPDISWFGPQPGESPWVDDSHCLGCWINTESDEEPDLVVLFNAGDHDRDFALPSAAGIGYRRLVDTADPEKRWLLEPQEAPALGRLESHPVRAHSLVILCTTAASGD
jgi:glycogen operon protein